jgi:branched-chain amino acid transport system substrate-binding protein
VFEQRARLLAASAVLVVVVAACSSSSKSGSSSATTTTGGANSQTSALPDVNQNFKASGPLTASAPGITPTTIKLGYVTSQTGIASSTFKGGDAGAKARIDLQNEQGGIDGRKIELVTADDGGALGPKGAAQELVETEKVFGVIDLSAFVVSAAPYLQQAGVPVTGGAFDGPEWGEQPYTNMFSWAPPVYTPFNGKYYTYDGVPNFLKSLGVTKLGALAYGVSQSAVQSSKSVLEAASPLGISTCYQNGSVGFGQTSFTTEALAIQQKGCNGTIASMVDASDVGLSASLKQAGVDAKQFYYTAYDQSVLDDSNASTALDGAYFPATPNFTNPTVGTQQMVNAMRKYAPSIKGIPTLGEWGSYWSADVMIKGLEVAGQNPTRQSFITNMRQVAGYDGNGLYSPGTLSFTGFGTVAMFPPQTCSDYVQLKNGEYVTVAKNVCGKLVATTG